MVFHSVHTPFFVSHSRIITSIDVRIATSSATPRCSLKAEQPLAYLCRKHAIMSKRAPCLNTLSSSLYPLSWPFSSGGAITTVADDDEGPADELGRLLEPNVGENAYDNSPRHGHEGNNKANTPLASIETSLLDLEHTATDEDDANLQTNHQKIDEDEELVTMNTF
ncbi:calcium-translocating P-type ATPase PMCA-type [Colletotrichum asianum]